MSIEKEITRIANFIKFPIKGKLSYTKDNIIQMKIANNQQLIGYSTIINFLHNETSNKKNIEEFYFTKQFFDFGNVFIRKTSAKDKYAACQELDAYLESRSYLIGQNLSLADLVVFYSLKDIMLQLNFLAKENYLNLSRWFDHIQSHSNIIQQGKVINFSTIHLKGWN